MSDSGKTASSGGISFMGLLAIVFITLKLTGHITWSWCWVLAPIWVPPAVLLCVAIIALMVAGVFFVIAGIIEHGHKQKAKRK